jgi:hypothetical protein
VRLPHRVIIVRRDVFQAILSGLGGWPTGTSVMWDRWDRIVGVAAARATGAGRVDVAHPRLHRRGNGSAPPEVVRLQPLTSPALAAGRLLPV